jgi:hypothetical protein
VKKAEGVMEILEAWHYGVMIATCVPADPQSKGGSEATVRIAKADLVPTDYNLRPPMRASRSLRRRARSGCRSSRLFQGPPSAIETPHGPDQLTTATSARVSIRRI